MADAGSAPARKVAVIVVHGVGDNQPGSTVNYVVGSLCGQKQDQHAREIAPDDGVTAQPFNEVHTLSEPSSQWRIAADSARALNKSPEVDRKNNPQGRTFTVYGRHLDLPGSGKAAFYELHWADFARSGGNWWHTIKSFARFVFEIPHVVDGFLRDAPGMFSIWLRRLLLLATCFVRGPLAGYSTVMLTGGLIFLSFSWIPDREEVAALIGGVRDEFIVMLPASMIPGVVRALDWLPDLGSRQGLLATLTTIAAVGLALLLAFRKRLAVSAFAFWVTCSALFYLLDATVLRPGRYPGYHGLVYIDYVSVMLFGLAVLGLYVFRTRLALEVGFADLGIAIAAWSTFFVLHLSPIGDTVRRWVDAAAPLLKSDVKTASSDIHFSMFAMFYPYLKYLWGLWALIMLLAFILAAGIFLANVRSWGERHRGIFAALALAIAQACVWLTAIPAAGVLHIDDVLCRGSRNYATDKPPVSCQSKLAWNNQTVDTFLRLHHQDEKALAAMPPYLRAELAKSVTDRFRYTLDLDMLRAMRELAMSFIYHGFVLVFAGGMAVAVALYRYSRARMPGLKPERTRLPRLIISSWVLTVLLAFGALNIALCFAWLRHIEAIRPVLDAVLPVGVDQIHVPSEVVQMAMLATTALIVICQFPAISIPLSGVLQIMQGLIDHHYRMRVSLLPRFWSGKGDKPTRRDHITRRLEEIVTRLVAGKGFTDVVLLSHSQGSVIVYDYLSGGAPGLDARVHVLTAGSPLGALYGYYFNEYNDIECRLGQLRPTIASWTNIYRSDDAIAGPILDGGEIESGEGPPIRYREVALKPGGHMRYWEEPAVCDAIRNLLLGRPCIPDVMPPGTAQAGKGSWLPWRARAADTAA